MQIIRIYHRHGGQVAMFSPIFNDLAAYMREYPEGTTYLWLR